MGADASIILGLSRETKTNVTGEIGQFPHLFSMTSCRSKYPLIFVR
jgi:hypothetical protein